MGKKREYMRMKGTVIGTPTIKGLTIEIIHTRSQGLETETAPVR